MTRGGDHRRRHYAMVAGAVRRCDGVRVRVRASAVDETCHGQGRAGPDSGALRAQERPGGCGVAGAVVRTRSAGGARPGRAAVLRGRGWAVERETREREKGGGQANRSGAGRGSAAGRRSGAEREEGSSARGRRKEREKGKEREKKRKWEKEKKKRKRKKEGREIKREREGGGERVGADRGRGRPRVAPGRA